MPSSRVRRRRVAVLATALGGAVLLGAAAQPTPDAAAGDEAFRLRFPLACTPGQTCEVQYYVDHEPGPGARDYRCFERTTDGRKDTTIRVRNRALQRAGVDVLAAASGRVTSMRDGMPDAGERDEQARAIRGRECGNGVVIDHGDGWVTQYCHMRFGSVRPQVTAGDVVAAGDVIGQVGLSGLTEYPHLGFLVRYKGEPIDPFAPLSGPDCTARPGLWAAQDRPRLAYKRGAILNAGFAGEMADGTLIADGRIAAPAADAPVLLAFVHVINGEAGDEHRLRVSRPDGSVLAENTWVLPRTQAQSFFTVGGRRPGEGWPPGVYRGAYAAMRDGKVVLQRAFEVRL